MLSEISQAVKDKYHMISYISGTQSTKRTSKANLTRDTEIKNKLLVTRGAGIWGYWGRKGNGHQGHTDKAKGMQDRQWELGSVRVGGSCWCKWKQLYLSNNKIYE